MGMAGLLEEVLLTGALPSRNLQEPYDDEAIVD
jgi:hypothetical protein